MNTKRSGLAAIGLVGLVLCGGCSRQTLESAQEDTERNVEAVQREAKRAERKARPQLRKIDIASRVYAALQANQKLPKKTIRVDPNENGVKLRGKVKTRAQKELAGRIARDTLAEDKTVTNDLKVEEDGEA